MLNIDRIMIKSYSKTKEEDFILGVFCKVILSLAIGTDNLYKLTGKGAVSTIISCELDM